MPRTKTYTRWCRHCQTRPVSRARRLCSTCYNRPAVRDLYPREPSRYSVKGHGIDTGGYQLPDAPTCEAPGTPGKIAVMEERARQGRAIFHPLDLSADEARIMALQEAPPPEEDDDLDPLDLEEGP